MSAEAIRTRTMCRSVKPVCQPRRMSHLNSQNIQPSKEHSSLIQGRWKIRSSHCVLIADQICYTVTDRLPVAATRPAGLNVRVNICGFLGQDLSIQRQKKGLICQMAPGKKPTRSPARIAVPLPHEPPFRRLVIAFLNEPATVEVLTFKTSPISL
jgi:hypothetical protein